MADQTSENVTKRVKLDESNDTETQSRVWIAVPEHAHEYFSREVPNEFESLAFREKLLATSLRNGFSEDNPAATPTPLKERKAVFILGPSAAGKTRALRTVASQLLGETTTNQKDANSESITTIAKPALGAYVLDGANFRSVSKTWATLLQSATEHSFTQKEMEAMNVKSTQLDNKEQEFYLAGYSDGYKKFFKKPTDKLKKELTEHFIDEGASCSDLSTLQCLPCTLGFNTVIPDTCSNVETIVKQALALQENGYSLQVGHIVPALFSYLSSTVGSGHNLVHNVQVLFVYASRSVCERRGVQREIGEGKKYDSKNWQKSTEAIAYFMVRERE